jgi:hypothetical protein
LLQAYLLFGTVLTFALCSSQPEIFTVKKMSRNIRYM